MSYKIDNLQYCNWSKEIFEINNKANLDAVHATICYHEDFDELKINIEKWEEYFRDYSSLIFQTAARDFPCIVHRHHIHLGL